MKHVSLILRTGLAFAFLYPAISAVFNPLAWIGYFPEFARAIIPNDTLLLHLFGLAEAVIGLWLLSGKHIFYPSVAAAVFLLLIVAFNFSQMDVVFRDLSIFAIAIALVVLHFPKRDIL